jgi:hypothetical protein
MNKTDKNNAKHTGALQKTEHQGPRAEECLLRFSRRPFHQARLFRLRLECQRFLWLYYARTAAYPRDAKPSPFVRDFDRHHVSRNVWDFKLVFRRRAQIGPTSKGI